MIGILAGETSGDQLGAGLINHLRKKLPQAQYTGIGGPLMEAQGFDSLYPMERLSVMGFIDPLKRLPELLRIRKTTQNFFLKKRPEVFIGIDSPDFNLGLEVSLRKSGIPVIHYVSPSVWAWRQKRIYKIAKACSLVLTLFPFEMDFFLKHGINARFVGHPLADKIPLESDKTSAKISLGLSPNKPYLAILPGSRKGECQQMMPVFLKAAEICKMEKPDLSIISAASSQSRMSELKNISRSCAPKLPLQIFIDKTRDVIAAADVVLVTSGTATLETMLVGRPMVIAYKMSPLIYPIVRPLIKTPFMGLPNLLAGKEIVPELVQNNVTDKNIAKLLMEFLESPIKTTKLYKKFKLIHQQLKCDADRLASEAVLDIINK